MEKIRENRQIGIILNPRARKVKRNPEKMKNRFEKIVGTYGEVNLTFNDIDLEKTLNHYKDSNYRFLGITGGDGTLHHVISMIKNRFSDYDPCILVLKGGTMDNVGRSKGIQGSDTAILSRFIKIVLNDFPLTVREQSLIRVGDNYGFIVGAGFITSFLKKAYEKRKGYFQNVVAGVDTVADAYRDKKSRRYFRALRGDFYVDGERLPFQKAHGIICATVSSLAHGVHPMYRAKGREDICHCIINGRSAPWLVSHALLMLSGRPIKSQKKHFDGVIERFEISLPGPFDYTIDGDIYTSSGNLVVEKAGKVKIVIL